MKKLLGLVLSFVLMISVFNFGNLNVFAATYGGTCGPNVKWSFNSTNGLLNITGSGDMDDCDGYGYAPWKDYYSGSDFTEEIKKVVISSGVTSIGVDAFSYCTSLTSVTIPNSITRIGNSAFSFCTSLTSVTIPNSVTRIGNSAFSDCTSLTSVIIPNSVTRIGKWAFLFCTSLTSITVENSNLNYSSINGVLFNKTKTKLIQYPIGKTKTSFIVPNSVTSIGVDAFSDCTSLTSVTIPNSVTSIGDGAFELCESLTSVKIGNSVTSIGDSAFKFCESLKNATIPNSVTSIGAWAFASCDGLKKIMLSKKLKSIGEGAFELCESLTSVTIPNSVTSIGDCAFNCCNSLSTVHIGYGVREIGTKAFSYCPNLKSIIIPNSVTSIGKFAFGAYTETEEKMIIDKQFIIYGHRGNKSEYYAKNSGVRFIDCHKGSTSITKSTLSKNGKKVVNCAICNKTVTSTIYYPKTIKLSSKSYVYNGKAKKPSVIIKASNGKTISSSNYTVKYASGRKKVGKYSVKITFKGKYSGSKTLYFKIKPKKTSISSVSSPKSAQVKVKWKKVSNIDGYEIQVSKSSKFTSQTKKYSAKASSKTKTVRFAKKARSYVRIRTYKKVNGKKYYSSWSKVKSIKTK